VILPSYGMTEYVGYFFILDFPNKVADACPSPPPQ
jgi:hypothetical protein